MKTFSSKGVEHVSDILSEKGIIPWKKFNNKYSLKEREHFKWVQLIDAVPRVWKDIIRSDSHENDPSTILDCSNIIFLNQKPVSVKTLTSKVIYGELISRIEFIKNQQYSKILKQSYDPLQVRRLIWTGK